MKRRSYSAAFKAQVVQEVLRGERSLAQIGTEEHKVHPNMLTQWKAAAIKGLTSLFDENRKSAQREDEHQALVEELYGQIGRLTTEVAWLKMSRFAHVTRAKN
jgi:transposase-like protein